MKQTPTTDIQTQIDRALEDKAWFPPIPDALHAEYGLEQHRVRRPYNRILVALFAVIFDLFLLTQIKAAPELVPLSAFMRLGVMTPCFLAFVLLDRREKLTRYYDPALIVVAMLPIVISAILCIRTISGTTLSDIRATPLIILTTGMIWRQVPWAAIFTASASAIILIAAVVLVGPSVVPRAELGSLILIDVCMTTTAIAFAVQLERRDRRIFLMRVKDRRRTEALAAVNVDLLESSHTDSLTGVANRRCFDETLTTIWLEALNRRQKLSLIMLDVDHFKKFNDHYGHQGGDDCLRAVAVQARDQMRGNDVFARYGGEEFAVIVRNAWVDEAVHVAERMRAAVAGLRLPHHGVGPDAIVSISVGVASAVPDSVIGVRRLIEAADAALYNAKRDGRNRVCATATESQQPSSSPKSGCISVTAPAARPIRAANEDLEHRRPFLAE